MGASRAGVLLFAVGLAACNSSSAGKASSRCTRDDECGQFQACHAGRCGPFDFNQVDPGDVPPEADAAADAARADAQLGPADAAPPADAARAVVDGAVPPPDAARGPADAAAAQLDAAPALDSSRPAPDAAPARDATPPDPDAAPPWPTVRQAWMYCVFDAVPVRPAVEFQRGRVADLQLLEGCDHQALNDTVQACVTNNYRLIDDGDVDVLAWVQRGGQLIIPAGIVGHYFSALLHLEQQFRGTNGDPRFATIAPPVQRTPDDLFWRANPYAAPALAGWSQDLAGFGLVPLGGWSADSVSFGYLQLGAGRIWVVGGAWEHPDPIMFDADRDLMASMILGGGPVYDAP
jgi:hypothetical protein